MAGPIIPNISALQAIVEKRDKILKRFLFYSLPKQASDIKIKTVSKNAYVVYPYFAVDKNYLYFPAVPGVEGVVLGAFKTPKHADYFVRLLNPGSYNKYTTVGGDTSDFYKFILNRAFLAASFVYDKKKDEHDRSNQAMLYPEDKFDTFYSSFVKDLNYLVQYVTSILKQEPQKYEGTFIGNFIDFDAVGKTVDSTLKRGVSKQINMFPTPTSNSNIISQETSDGINEYYAKNSSKNLVLPSEEVYAGIRHYITLSKLYGVFMKADGYNINKNAPSQDIAVGQLFKSIKLLMRDFKGTDPLVIVMVKNFDIIEANLIRLSRYHINVAGTRQKSNVNGIGVNVSDYYGWNVVSQVFDPDQRSNPKIRIKIPKAYVRFMLNRSKSMKNVIMKMPQQKVKQFLILMYYPILTVYMYFFQMTGADPDEVFQYEKYVRYMADWFEKTNEGRGGFEFVDDKTGFYARAERIIKNFK